MKTAIKWIMLVLMLIGVAATVWVFVDKTELSVSWLLIWAYVMFGLAILSVILGIVKDGLVRPKSFLKIGIVLAVAAVIVLTAYFLPALHGGEGLNVTDGQLKLTDTILYLTYFSVAASIVAVIATAIRDVAKK